MFQPKSGAVADRACGPSRVARHLVASSHRTARPGGLLAGYDVIVLGLGGMGSATLFHLARRGLRVLGLERFDLVHEYGSSHGLTRIIRLAYWEHPTYVSLLRRAYELWRELEGLAGERSFTSPAAWMPAPRDGAVFQGALKSSELHGLPHEVMDGAELHRRFPGYRLPGRSWACTSPKAASSCPSDATSRTSIGLAHGAEIRCREPVWTGVGQRTRVGAHEPRALRGGPARCLRGPMGIEARPRAARPRRPGTPGAGMAQPGPARVLPAERVPGFQSGGRGGSLSTASRAS